LFLDLSRGDAFIVSIIPFADVVCDLYFCVCADGLVAVGSTFFPGELLAAAEVEEFEGALGPAAGGYVSVMTTIENLQW